MFLKERARGERIPHQDYNALVKEYNAGPDVRYENTFPRGLLYGENTEVAPVYSLLEVYDKTLSSPTNNEIPLVGVRKPTSASPIGLVTNGAFPTANGQSSPVMMILEGVIHKFDVGTSDSGFTVGEECGPANGSYQLSSSGTGLVCLSAPITYQTSRKFVWAAARGAGSAATGSIYLYTLTAAISAGSGTATIKSMDDVTTIATGETIEDPLGHMEGLASGVRGVCVKSGSTYYAITPYVFNLRLSSPNLQYLKHGTAWQTWHEAGTSCP